MARLNYDTVYDGDISRVHSLLTDEAFLNACLDEAKATDRDVRVQRGADKVNVSVRATVPVDGLPPIARPFVGASVQITQTFAWSRTSESVWRATLLIEVAALRKGEATGEALLEAAGEKSPCRVTADVRVNVPFIGGQIADLAVGLVRELLDDQAKLANRWLAEGYAGNSGG